MRRVENYNDKKKLIKVKALFSLGYKSKSIDYKVYSYALPIVFDLLCYDLYMKTSNCTMSESAEYT